MQYPVASHTSELTIKSIYRWYDRIVIGVVNGSSKTRVQFHGSRNICRLCVLYSLFFVWEAWFFARLRKS